MLTKSLSKLSVSEKVLLAQELWDNAAPTLAVSNEEVDYVKSRLADIKKRGSQNRKWTSIKMDLIK